MNENRTLFDIEAEADKTGAKEQISISGMGKLDVVKMDFVEAETLTWQELFTGFDKLYCITYSSGIDFTCELVKRFGYAEIIYGCEDVISFSLHEIIAYQIKTIERIRERFKRSKINLLERIDDNTLKMYVARGQLSHEKLYLLEADDGRKRVVMGSANMSYAAFSGRQRENISYIDGERAFEWYKASFDGLKSECTDNISNDALRVSDVGDNLEEIPVMQTVRINKALVVEPVQELRDEVRFVLDIKNLSNKLASYMPKADKKGRIQLSPETVKLTRRRITEAEVREKELRNEYPQLKVDIAGGKVTLNGIDVDLYPSHENIHDDVALFLEYMNGYRNFHGDVDGMQTRYYEFANWFFVSPFMATMRNVAYKYNQTLFPYPVFGLVYGQSKAGKTSFLETLLKMMIGQKTKLSAPDFTRSGIESLKRTVEGAPIIVDDLTQMRFSQHAVETIKNDDFGIIDDSLFYPAVVISANEDVKAVAPEVVRRTVICRVQAGLTNTELMKSNVVRHVQKNIGTAFYREYLRRMLEIVPGFIEILKDDEMSDTPDILAASSEVIRNIIAEHAEGELPSFVRPMSLENYFSERVTGAHAVKIIRDAWRINRKSFEIDRKHNQLRYNAGQVWEVDRIMKELPENLEAFKSREWVVIDLERASEYFQIDFKKGSFWRR